MLIIFNILVIGLVLLIAYWWGNQGLFSALLHLVAVIAAGAIALGLWEPIVVGLLLRGSNMDNFMWGLALIVLFAVVLFLLRLGTDKLAPANVDLPRWANLIFGGAAGFGAGVLTIGMLLIGAGHMQTTSSFMGFRPYGRSQDGEIVRYTTTLWMPVHFWTAEFYGWLSVSSMWTPTPLRHHNPMLHWQSALIRDTFRDGRAPIAMGPDDASVIAMQVDAEAGLAAVQMQFQGKAIDFGDQLTMSNAQVRLIGAPAGRAEAPVTHPTYWMQDGRVYPFDNPTHYATSVSGRQQANITFYFDLKKHLGQIGQRAMMNPQFIQVRGVRYRLPRSTPTSLQTLLDSAGGTSAPYVAGRPIPEHEIKVSNDIRPITVSLNSLPSGMSVSDGFLVEGHADFPGQRNVGISRNLQIHGIYEPEGTRIVRLNVSRNTACDIFNDGLRDIVGQDAVVELRDSTGQPYPPLGYRLSKGGGEGYEMKLAPGEFVRTLAAMPYLSTSGSQRLDLYFRVTENVTLTEFAVGVEVVGVCDVYVEPK